MTQLVQIVEGLEELEFYLSRLYSANYLNRGEERLKSIEEAGGKIIGGKMVKFLLELKKNTLFIERLKVDNGNLFESVFLLTLSL